MMAEPSRRAAYGLALTGDEPLLAFLAPAPTVPLRRTVVQVVDPKGLEARWPQSGTRRLSTETPEPDAPPRTIDEHPAAGWRLDAPGWGLARVARDGSLIECARGGAEEWRWQRFLVGRVLPFAAVAAGLEVLHAAAVVLGEGALAISGESGSGKSSVAAALHLAGAPLLADDVLAVEQLDGRLAAHAGPPLIALRDAEIGTLGDERVQRIGGLVGAGGGKAYLAVRPPLTPVPLTRLALLRRLPDPGGVAVHTLVGPRARELLTTAFLPELATPARLRGQLSLLATLATGVEVLEVVAGSDADAVHVAEALAA